MGVNQSPDLLFLSALRTILLLLGSKTTASFCRNHASYPASQNCPTERSDIYLRSGYMCPFLASSGKSLCLSKHSADAGMVFPVGVPHIFGMAIGVLVSVGASSWSACSEQPVSSTPCWFSSTLWCGLCCEGN